MLDRLLTIWRAAGMDPLAHVVGDGTLVTLARGARAVPFDDRGRPLLWLAPQVQSGADVAAWAASSAWNFGAERLWIGPEIEFMVADRTDFGGSYLLPPTMDPGGWTTLPDSGTGERHGPGFQPITYRHAMSLYAHGQASSLSIEVEQTLTPVVAGAVVAGAELDRLGVKHLGWAREVTLRRAAADAGSVACQAWVLIQAHAGATVLVPGAAGARVTDYFEPVDDRHLAREGDDLVLRLTGRQRYKVGVATGAHRGQVAYWRELQGGQALLLVRSFSDDPGTRYLEQPPERPDHGGDSVYVYNDDGRYGDFGEVEVLGRALEPHEAEVSDRFELHAWWGEREAVLQGAERLLGSSSRASQAATSGTVARQRPPAPPG